VYTIRKTLLFPLQSGTFELEPVEVSNQVHLITRSNSRSSRNGLFDDPMIREFFGGNDPFADAFFEDMFSTPQYEVFPYDTKSPTIKIEVLPLPTEGKPASFRGAVGRFDMQANVDKTSLTTDDAIDLKVQITGEGNVNLLNAPPLEVPAAFEQYEPTITDNIQKNSNPLRGSRTFQYVLMPQQDGKITMPAVEFSYFDPVEKAYKTIRSDIFKFDIAPGKSVQRSSQDFSNQNQLYPILKGNPIWTVGSPFFCGSGYYWILFILPFLLLGILFFLQRRKLYQQEHATVLKHKHAHRVALKRLKRAGKFLKEGKDKVFYEEVSKGIWGYISDKLKIPQAELTKELVQNKLIERKVPESVLAPLHQITERCEMALYAPNSTQQLRENAFEEAVSVIVSLEEALKAAKTN
jgi:hypothetical protein